MLYPYLAKNLVHLQNTRLPILFGDFQKKFFHIKYMHDFFLILKTIESWGQVFDSWL